MILSELLKLFPHTQSSDWHQHNNGKGWIYKDAYADITAYVGPNAVVTGNAIVADYAYVEENAAVAGYAIVRDYARVYGNAIVAGNAVVKGNARVTGNAWVKGNAIVGDYAIVEGNTILNSGIYSGFDITNLDLAYCLNLN